MAIAKRELNPVEQHRTFLIENVDWLCEKVWKIRPRIAAGRAGLNDAAFRNIMKRRNYISFANLVLLGDALGVPAAWLLLKPSELRQRVAKEGVRPFEHSPPPQWTGDSASSTGDVDNMGTTRT